MKYAAFLSILLFLSCTNEKENNPDAKILETPREDQLEAAVKKYPDSALLIENLAQYYRDGGNYEKAIATVNRALQVDSTRARYWDMKAILHFENGDTLQAIHAFEKAVGLVPEPAYIISLATLYAQTKNKRAVELADALLIGYKAHAEKEAYFIKGLYFSAIGKKQDAISFFNEALQVSPTFMEAYREKALALYDQQQYMEALLVLEKAVKLNNSFEEGYYYMGRCFEKLNRKEDAIESYQTALIYAPDFSEAKEALANLGVKQ